ncbi:MAG: hypothetical protein NT027_07110 [Proteobacteria bacterium]|nr:hypothetical protein [Pseudomonadota bacterium]
MALLRTLLLNLCKGFCKALLKLFLFIPIATFTFVGTFCDSAFAVNQGPMPLQIEISKELVEKLSPKDVKALQSNCANFHKRIVVLPGAPAENPFTETKCHLSLSQGESGSSRDPSKKDDPWLIRIKPLEDARKAFLVSLIFRAGAKDTEIYKVEFADTLSVSKLFSNTDVGIALGQRLNLALPSQGFLKFAPFSKSIFPSKKTDSSKEESTSESSESQTVTEPKSANQTEYYLCLLVRDRGLFRAKYIIGQVKWNQSSSSDAKDLLSIVSRVKPKLATEISDFLAKNSVTHLSVVLHTDRDKSIKSIDKKLADYIAKEVVKEKQSPLVGKGKPKLFGSKLISGIRIGMPVLSGVSPFAKSKIFGVFLEARSGPVRGLRFSYDWIPKSEYSVDKEELSGRWSSFQMGWSIGWDIDSALASRIDMTPNIGVTNLEASSELSTRSGVISNSFVQKNSPTTGVEFGVEKAWSAVLLRLWSYAGISTGVTPLDKMYRTRSLKAGMNQYFGLFEVSDVRVAVYGFGSFESTTITKTVIEETDSEDASGVEYSNIYLGTGITIAL